MVTIAQERKKRDRKKQIEINDQGYVKLQR